MIRKILAPTDLSELSATGVRYALTTARRLDAELTVYYVVTGNEITKFRRRKEERVVARDIAGLMTDYKLRLARFVEQNFADLMTSVNVSQKVEFGTPERTIVKTAKTEGVDLIIMATYGRSGLSRMVRGSVTEEVIRNAPCLVLAIPPNLESVGEDLHFNAHRKRVVHAKKTSRKFR
jgi:nucleotide-binding universal stress UspA family protein